MAASAQAAAQTLPIAFGQVLGQQGDSGFRCDHQITLGAQQLRFVPLKRLGYAAGLFKLFVLRDAALQKRDTKAARILRPLVPRRRNQQGRDEQRHRRQPSHRARREQATGWVSAHGAHQRLRHSHADKRCHRANAVGAQPGRKERQGSIDMGIATRAPAKAGKPGAARQLGHHPQQSK